MQSFLTRVQIMVKYPKNFSLLETIYQIFNRSIEPLLTQNKYTSLKTK